MRIYHLIKQFYCLKPTLQLAAVEARRAQQVVLEWIESGPPVGGATCCHASPTSSWASGRSQREWANTSSFSTGGRGGGRGRVGVMDGGAQRCGQRRALRGHLGHRIGAFSDAFQRSWWGRGKEEARARREEWRRRGWAWGRRAKWKGFHGMETGSLRGSFGWQSLGFRLARARSTGFGGSGDVWLAECEHRALMAWSGKMQQEVRKSNRRWREGKEWKWATGDMTDGQSGSVECVLKRCVWAFRGCELSVYHELNYEMIKSMIELSRCTVCFTFQT